MHHPSKLRHLRIFVNGKIYDTSHPPLCFNRDTTMTRGQAPKRNTNSQGPIDRCWNGTALKLEIVFMKAFPRKLEKLLLLRYSLILSFVAKQCTAQKKDIARWAGWILWLPEPQSFDPGAIGWFLVPFVDVCSWPQLVMLISYITLYPCHSSLQNQEYERIPHPCFLLLFPNLLVIAPF